MSEKISKGGRGGARPGSGRKQGAPNKRTAERTAEVEASGQTPLDYMLGVMRDPGIDEKRRDAMAAAVAPYVHAKLSAVQLTGEIKLSHEKALDELE